MSRKLRRLSTGHVARTLRDRKDEKGRFLVDHCGPELWPDYDVFEIAGWRWRLRHPLRTIRFYRQYRWLP